MVGERRYVDLDYDGVAFTATLIADVDGQRQLLLAGHADDEVLVYGSSLPAQRIPDPQTMLHGGDLIRALAFELPVSFDQAYESDLEPLGPYWRLRHIEAGAVPNAFDVVMTVDGESALASATVSFGPVHRTQLEPVPEYLVTVDATQLLDVVRAVMRVTWSRD